MSYVVESSNSDAKHKEVANLRWLLRHCKEVASFEVCTNKAVFIDGWTMPRREYSANFDCIMIARMKVDKNGNERKFVTQWMDHGILLDWVDRPVFRGLPIIWFSLKTVVGEWNR
jgi:hypothetical protein